MSKLITSKERNSLLPDVQHVEHDSPLVCGDLKVLFDDEAKEFPLFDKEYFSSPQRCDRPSNSSTSFLNDSSEDEKARTPHKVFDLIQACAPSNPSELQVYDHSYLQSNTPSVINKSTEDSRLIKPCQSSNFNYRDTSKKFSDDSMKDMKKSKSNSSSFLLINRRRSTNSLKNKSSGDAGESFLSSQNGSSFFKKQTQSSSSPNVQSQPTQMKTKLRSLWNNMKYGWRVKREVNLKLDSVTYILGKCYDNKSSDSSVHDALKELKLDLLSKIWLTYRINFPVIPGTDLISDSGWGCMLRCGQMMMAQALVCHFLHRDWRISSNQPDELQRLHRMILRWFGDTLSENSPFSLHHLVSLGENYGRRAGDWYGPTHAAQVLRDALNQAKRKHPQLKNMCMYVALDGIVFKQDVMDLFVQSTKHGLPATSGSLRGLNNSNCSNSDISQSSLDKNITRATTLNCETWNSLYPSLEISQIFTDKNGHSKINNSEQTFFSDVKKNLPFCECIEPLKGEMEFDPCPSYSEYGPPSFNTALSYRTSLILFVSVRLGNDKINPFYIPCLKSLLTYEHCIGIIGGRPKHALYFIGWQGEDKLIHMDPHSCQPAIDVEKEDFNEKSFHSSSIRTMSFSEMDPSCAIGFYFSKQKEFQEFVDNFSEITAPMKKNLDYPVFALAEGKRVDVEENDCPKNSTRTSFLLSSSKTDEDDYILL